MERVGGVGGGLNLSSRYIPPKNENMVRGSQILPWQFINRPNVCACVCVCVVCCVVCCVVLCCVVAWRGMAWRVLLLLYVL